MSNGIQMTEAEYSALDAIRASSVKVASRSTLAHLRHDLEREREDTDAFRVGRALHCAVLRPDEFAAEFAVAPKFDRRTKAGKEQHEAACVAAEGRTLLDAADAHIVDAMRVSIESHPSARAALEICDLRERVWLGEIAGAKCKCRADAVGGGLLLDLKTTVSASPHSFARSCVEYGYHIQFAFYAEIMQQNGVDISDCMVIAVEKTAPYAVACYRLLDADLARAFTVAERCVKRIAEAKRSNTWQGYSDGVIDITLPPWAFGDASSEEAEQ